MRELKFRAWQTVTKVMFSNIERGMGEPHGNAPFADYNPIATMMPIAMAIQRSKSKPHG